MDSVQTAVLDVEGLQALLDVVRRRGYRVVGPVVKDQAIVLDDFTSLAYLPRGWNDEQAGGRYRLAQGEGAALFGYAAGPQSWKKFLHPAILRLWRLERDGNEVRVF